MINIDELLKSRKYKKELRCIHRHTITEHPACFRRGLIKWPNDRVYERFTEEKWYQLPEYRMGYFDIETDNLYADFGTVLTWCIKLKDGPIYSSVITKEELFQGEDVDRRLVEEFVQAIRDYNIILGYNSTRFDLPFMRAKAIRYDLDFPMYGEIYHWDLYYTAKSKLRVSRKSLENVCDYLGIEGKTPIEKDVWRKAKYGDKKSLEQVLEHNIGDVEILEQLHDKLDFTRKWIRTSI